MGWDGDDLAGQMEEVFERQQAVADARALRGTSTPEERARSAQFESLRASRSRIMTQLSLATNPAYRTVLERGLKSINDQMAEDEAKAQAIKEEVAELNLRKEVREMERRLGIEVGHSEKMQQSHKAGDYRDTMDDPMGHRRNTDYEGKYSKYA